MINRREFVSVLGSAAGWPLPARAQQLSRPVIGYLSGGSLETAVDVTIFQKGLRKSGFVENRNASIEYRWARNRYDRLPALAADLVRDQVAEIFAPATPAALAAKAAICRSRRTSPYGVGAVT